MKARSNAIIHKVQSKKTIISDNGKVTFLRCILIYTVFFIIIFLAGFHDFLFEHGKSFIWYLDGTKQHFPFLYDFAEMVKEMMKSLKGLPLWSWQLGLGADVIQSYSYYVLGDPFSILIGLFLPLTQVELGYNIIVMARMYFIGISFLYYCKYMKLRDIPSVIGSLLYSFSGHILFWGLRHPFFMNPAILLPLLFIGVEEILKNKKSHLFIICIAISAINSFYFCYMNTIALFIYALIRYHYYVERRQIKKFVYVFSKMIGYYILGMAIGAVTFVPTIYGFLNTYRVPSKWMFDYLPTIDKCKQMFNLFIIMDYEKRMLRLSVTAISIPCIVLFLSFRDRFSKSYKVVFIVFTVILCLPFMHSVFNGFSAQNDRWLYIYISIISFIIAYSLDKMNQRSNNIILYWVFAFAYLGIIRFDAKVINLILILLGSACFITYIYEDAKPFSDHRGNKNYLFEISLLLLITANLSTNVDSLMSQQNYRDSFKQYNSVLNIYEEDKTAILSSRNKGEFYRVGYDDMSDNKSLINNFNGTHIYNSIIDKDIIEFYRYYTLRTKLGSSAYMGFDEISLFHSLMNIKYYIGAQNEKHVIPYGFELKSREEQVVVYENKNYLPLGFMYYNTLQKKDVNQLTSLGRIYSNMDGAVIEEKLDGISNKIPIDKSIELHLKKISQEGVTLLRNQAIVTKNGGSITFKVDHISGLEIFLLINRVYYENENKRFKISVETNHVKKTIETRATNNTYYVDNRDYLYNMGYGDNSTIEVTIRFEHKGEYQFDSIKVLGMPMEDFNSNINHLKESTLNNITYDNDFIRGNVNVIQKGILFLSIPHTPGWKAYVDGEKVETLKVNIGFTGIVLDKGKHEILLKYMPPFRIFSVVVSVMGLFIFMMIVIVDYRKEYIKKCKKYYILK